MFKIKKITPLFNMVVTTSNKYVGDQFADKGGLIIETRKNSGALNYFQRVIAVGSIVKDIEVGDIVKINFDRYLKVRHFPGEVKDNVQSDSPLAAYEVPCIEVNDQQCLLIQSNDIEFVVKPEDAEIDDGGLLQ